MVAKDMVSSLIPPLKTSDTGSKALRWMNEFCVIHLPIVNNEQFLGLISEEDILDLSEPDEPLGNHKLSLFRPEVNEMSHIYEVIKVAVGLKLSLVPVIDSNDRYLGNITIGGLLAYFAKTASINDNGGIIMLEVSSNDYSLSEIARLVESNDAKILSSFLTSHKESTQLEVTLKLNITDLKHVVATFERFSYLVVGSYQETDYYDDLKNHYDSFMNYLNI